MKTFDLKKQASIVFGGMGGIIVLFYLVMCTGGSKNVNSDDNSSEAVEAKIIAAQKKDGKERWDALLANYKKESILNKKTGRDDLLSMATNSGIVPNTKEIDSIMLEAMKKCKNPDELMLIAAWIENDDKFRVTYNLKKEDAWSYIIKSVKLTPKEKMSELKLPDNLTDDQLKEIAELGHKYAMYDFIKSLKKKSNEDAANWCIAQYKKGNKDILKEIVSLGDTKSAKDFLANNQKNFTEKDFESIKDTYIYFNFCVSNGKNEDAINVAEKILTAPSTNGFDENGKHVAFLVAKYNESNSEILKSLLDLSLKGNQKAYKLLMDYDRATDFGKYTQDIDLFIRWKYIVCKNELLNNNNDKLDVRVKNFIEITTDMFKRKGEKVEGNFTLMMSNTIPTTDTVRFVIMDLDKSTVTLKDDDKSIIYKSIYKSAYVPEDLKIKIHQKALDILLAKKLDDNKMALYLDLIGEKNIWIKNMPYILQKADSGDIPANFYYVYSSMEDGIDTPIEDIKKHFWKIYQNKDYVQIIGSVAFIYQGNKSVSFFTSLLDDIKEEKYPSLDDEAKGNMILTVSTIVIAFKKDQTIVNAAQSISSKIKNSPLRTFYQLSSLSPQGGRYVSNYVPNRECIECFKELLKYNNSYDGKLTVMTYEQFNIGFNRAYNELQRPGYSKREVSEVFTSVKSTLALMLTCEQKPEIYLLAGEQAFKYISIGRVIGDDTMIDIAKELLNKAIEKGDASIKKEANNLLKRL